MLSTVKLNKWSALDVAKIFFHNTIVTTFLWKKCDDSRYCGSPGWWIESSFVIALTSQIQWAFLNFLSLREADRSILVEAFFVFSSFPPPGLSWIGIQSLSHVPMGKAETWAWKKMPIPPLRWMVTALPPNTAKQLVVTSKSTPAPTGDRELRHVDQNRWSCNHDRYTYINRQ